MDGYFDNAFVQRSIGGIFAPGDSGQVSGYDTIGDLHKGAVATGDVVKFFASVADDGTFGTAIAMTRGGSSAAATASEASINQTTGVATFASGSGATLANDVVVRLAGQTSIGSIDLTNGNLTVLG